MVDVSLLPPAITAGAALVGASLGSGLTAYFTAKRLRFDQGVAEREAQRQRREDARPKVGTIADRFMWLEGLMAIPIGLRSSDVLDILPEQWDSTERELRRLILEVPDALLRDQLDTLVRAINISHDVGPMSTWGDERRYVRVAAGTGGELAGGWLRQDEAPTTALDHLEVFEYLVGDWEQRMAEEQELRDEAREARGS